MPKGLDWRLCQLSQTFDGEDTEAEAGDEAESVIVIDEDMITGDVPGLDWGGDDDTEEGIVRSRGRECGRRAGLERRRINPGSPNS